MLSQKVCEYLRWLKESGDFTQQLSDLTGVPMGTIPKYFTNMDDESAGFETVRKLVTVMGGSLDELAGIRSDPAPLDERGPRTYAVRHPVRTPPRAHRLRGVLRRPRFVRDPVLSGFFNPIDWMDTAMKRNTERWIY